MVRIIHMLRIFIWAHPELLGNNIWIRCREVNAKVITFFQIACCTLLEVLCAKTLVATIEAADIWKYQNTCCIPICVKRQSNLPLLYDSFTSNGREKNSWLQDRTTCCKLSGMPWFTSWKNPDFRHAAPICSTRVRFASALPLLKATDGISRLGALTVCK